MGSTEMDCTIRNIIFSFFSATWVGSDWPTEWAFPVVYTHFHSVQSGGGGRIQENAHGRSVSQDGVGRSNFANKNQSRGVFDWNAERYQCICIWKTVCI